MKKEKILEWSGVITAIIYSLLVALNIGAEFFGFTLLLISAILIGLWAFIGKHNGILLLQLFYASAGVIGMIRWFLLIFISNRSVANFFHIRKVCFYIRIG